MRTVFALLSGLVLFGVAIVNEKQNSQADDATTTIVEEVEDTPSRRELQEQARVIRLPVIESEPTAAIHIDDELKEQIDELTTRIDSTEERITALEQSVQESAEQAVQVGRVAMIESQLEDLHLRVDETQTLVTTGIEELKAAIAAIPEQQIVALPEPQVTEPDWSSETNPHYLLLFTTTNCPACETAKSQVDDFISHGWKIKTFAPDDPNASLYQVTRFPTWIALEHGEEVDRWTGADVNVMNAHLNAVFKPDATAYAAPSAVITFEPEPQQSLKSWIQSHSNGVDYTHPGSIRSHLLDHGWSSSEIAGLSNREMLELHDATHQGTMTPSRYRSGNYSNSSSSTRYTSYASNSSSYSSCPSGNCGGRMTRREVRIMNQRYGRNNW